ncbi:MAG: CinA family protein [Albidovulum sp.]
MLAEAQELVDLARKSGALIATAESCTGGMIAAALTDIAGSSVVFDRGFVTYSNDAKIEMLGVSADTLEAHGAVSPEVATEMAQGALAHSKATIAVSVTGIAGPGGSAFKPEGRVAFALAIKDGATISETHDFGALGRENVRRAATVHGLTLLLGALQIRR